MDEANEIELSNIEVNKDTVRTFIGAVWSEGALDLLDAFWSDDCINHAGPEGRNVGIEALRAYHEQFGKAFSGFTDVEIEIRQQVAEGDRVVTHMVTTATHTGPFFKMPPTGRRVSMTTIRIDRFEDGEIAEHWSVADMAGLLHQLNS